MDRRVLEATSYLCSHYEEQISVRDLGRVVRLSHSQFSRLFRRDAGMPPHRFLKIARLRRASHLLETTFLSVKEVMSLVGFNDPSHFVKDFERMFGESPRRYREHHHCDLSSR
jgi:transcriptional regulator GlxA family with amidase domain